MISLQLNNKRATILIMALWIITILTVFAVTVGRQSAIYLKITSYNIDKLKAYFIARAGIIRALAEKSLEYKINRSVTIDALSESWSNNKELFDRSRFGDGSYTLAYEVIEEEAIRKETGKSGILLYGLMDEQSKININYAPKETIANLIESFDVDTNKAQEIAAAIIDYRDEDNDAMSSQQDDFYGAEDAYYMGLSQPYHCKNSLFETIYELPLVRGVTTDLFDKLKDYITVYGDGKVNINTAGERNLGALFGPLFPKLASKLVRYRQGNDDIIGTRDDRWFSLGPYVIERGEEGMVEIKNLQDPEWYANIYGIATEEYNRIRNLISSQNAQLCANSKTYRVIALGEVRKVKAKIEAVYLFEEVGRPPLVKFWYEE